MRNAKVPDDGVVQVSQQDVRRFHVTVDDSFGVRFGEPECDIAGKS